MSEGAIDETASQRSEAFLAKAGQYRLRELVTEQGHSATRTLAEAAQRDPREAIEQLQAVDRDLPPVLGGALESEAFAQLEAAMRRSLEAGGRVFFIGCGATGRLAILLESLWRRASQASTHSLRGDAVISVMAGGDFALIKSVEGFEDFQQFGRHQLEAHGVGASDTVVAVTEGGETSFVIGAAWAGLDAGASTFFVYNNPDERLWPVERSRQVLSEPAIVKLNLTTGPMAVAGSTRMQATTIELAVLGAALERVVAAQQGVAPTSAATYRARFEGLLSELESAASRDVLADVAEREASLYRRGGRVLYQADHLMLDVLTDTTERSPTFSLPPFRKRGEDATASWSFIKNPRLSTESAWPSMLARPVRGLDWDRSAYERMEAPPELIERPPRLDRDTTLCFDIGREPENEPSDWVISIIGPSDDELSQYPCDAALRIGEAAPGVDQARPDWHLSCTLPDSPLDLSLHLAVKLVMNTISTATMAIVGRLTGHWMMHVRCSNMKLIDRGIRLLMDRADVDYETACRQLHRAMAEIESAPSRYADTSPVAHALGELGGH